ncbi:MAG: hypothetical protein CMB81_03735 [Flammeovirgaceae bacterium]|nr:hypothetical protein [Flammeovirgaceae bacterium]|tara:strand:- start:935 stop:1363 length:429 start_codon:yes stop_codon:yes gene_type:complete
MLTILLHENFINAGLLIPILGILLPLLIVLVVFYFSSKETKYKYDALIEATKNIKDSEDVKGLLESFKKRKKSNTDYRKTGLVTMFTGVGLAFFGNYGLKNDIVFGVGLLVIFIGVGQMIAGYVYPNQADEINNAVENFEKK